MRIVPRTRRGKAFAAAYLLVVAATLAFVVSTFVVFEGDGTANLSGVWLFFVTLPWSMVLASVSHPGREIPFVVIVLGLTAAAAINAALLGWVGDASGPSNTDPPGNSSPPDD